MGADLTTGYVSKIREEAESYGCSLEQTAYILATADHETNYTMEPVREAYWLGEQWRKQNLRYYPWYGRGFVQLTWEDNYRFAGNKLDVDLISEPDKAMDPDIAAKILVKGCMEGWFTGKKLPDYINSFDTDYVDARKVVNGVDRAGDIAALAKDYENLLREDRSRKVAEVGPVRVRSFWGSLITNVVDYLKEVFRR